MIINYSHRLGKYICFYLHAVFFITSSLQFLRLRMLIIIITRLLPFVLFIIQRLGNKYCADLWFHIKDPSCVSRCDLVAQLCIPTCRKIRTLIQFHLWIHWYFTWFGKMVSQLNKITAKTKAQGLRSNSSMSFRHRAAGISALINLSLNFFTLILSIMLVGKEAPNHHFSEAWRPTLILGTQPWKSGGFWDSLEWDDPNQALVWRTKNGCPLTLPIETKELLRRMSAYSPNSERPKKSGCCTNS